MADERELVLIADDNADMRAHLERVLSPHWRTVLVADGQEAIEAARKLRPDAVVTDVMMPRLDGFEFVAAIRADPALAATPVLMLSAQGRRGSHQRGLLRRRRRLSAKAVQLPGLNRPRRGAAVGRGARTRQSAIQ